MSTFTSIVSELERERARLTSQLASLDAALAALGTKGCSRRHGISSQARELRLAQRAMGEGDRHWLIR